MATPSILVAEIVSAACLAEVAESLSVILIQNLAEVVMAKMAVLGWANTLCLRLSEIYLFVPGEIGIFGLSDIGRVYLEGETSDTWHTAIGGGLWFSFLERTYIFSAALASSQEKLSFYIRAGFFF